jgi:5-methylthioribose kinase
MINPISENLISINNAAHYLLMKKLIDVKSIIQGDLRLIDSSRKNRNIRVIRNNDTSYLIKQAMSGDPYSIQTIQSEARIYTLARKDSTFSQLKEIVPSIYYYDNARNILICEFLTHAESMNKHIYENPPEKINLSLFNILGKTMATYHKMFINHSHFDKLYFLPKTVPSSLFIARPGPEILSRLSQGNLQLLKIVQEYPELHNFLDRIHQYWISTTLIHADIKWDNIIITKAGKNQIPEKVKIVDWELASFGDPAWDIGSVFQNFISVWLFNMRSSPGDYNRQINKQIILPNSYSFKNIKSHIRAFWLGYITTLNIENEKAIELLIRSAKYCAARLIQAAYESLQFSVTLSNLNRTEEAILHILGIPFRGMPV